MVRELVKWLVTAPDNIPEEERTYFGMVSFGSLLGFFLHLLFLIFFIALDIKVLAYFNIASILIFASGFLLSRVGKSNIAFSMTTIEIIAHAVLATYTFGLQAGFHLYLIGSIILWFLLNIPIRRKVLLGSSTCGVCLFLVHNAPYAVNYDHISPQMMHLMNLSNIFSLIIMCMGCSYFYHNAVKEARESLQKEFARSEKLLHNILPRPIADRLKHEEDVIADGFAACSVLFADIVGFTVLSQQMSPKRLVSMLNEIFSAFDNLVLKHNLEKIKTIGDAYMVASGIPFQQGNHALKIAQFALDMRDEMKTYSSQNGVKITVRIGIHSGPAVAGVIGKNKFIYDIWGDTVNTAARMESHGKAGEIHVSNLTRELLGTAYIFEDQGEISVKGKGMMRTWILVGSANDRVWDPNSAVGA